MRKFLIFISLIALCVFNGCTWTSQIAKDYTDRAANEINTAAFDGQVKASVCFCDRVNNSSCWDHHSLYTPSRKTIHIAPEWYWEPYIYFKGVIAHEMIHAYLDQSHREAMSSKPHSWKFMKERERVAKAIDIPVWAIPDGQPGDKLDATRDMAMLERSLKSTLDSMHGVINTSVSSPGWPTQLYDPQGWRDIPPPEQE